MVAVKAFVTERLSSLIRTLSRNDLDFSSMTYPKESASLSQQILERPPRLAP